MAVLLCTSERKGRNVVEGGETKGGERGREMVVGECTGQSSGLLRDWLWHTHSYTQVQIWLSSPNTCKTKLERNLLPITT
jgi:hypothetical protein